ncbi:hypothetical protein O6R16_01865 [Candidatus Rickettsia tasmanensis]
MKVTFNSIEKIYNLLTTEEWIDKKDPKKCLEQLNKKLAKASDTLKELLENNFDQLNTNDVFEKIHKQYLSTHTRLKKILLVKNYVRKYCHIVE